MPLVSRVSLLLLASSLCLSDAVFSPVQSSASVLNTTLNQFLNVSHKSKHVTLGRWHSTARVSQPPTYEAAAGLRARYCANLTCSDLNRRGRRGTQRESGLLSPLRASATFAVEPKIDNFVNTILNASQSSVETEARAL